MRHNEILAHLQNLTNRKIKQREIAEALGVDISKIGKRASRNSEYSEIELLMLENAFGVQLCEENWVKTRLMSKEIRQNLDDEFTAEYYPDIFGSCGTGTFVLSECKEKMSVPKKLVKNYNSIKKYSVINAYGDSMSPYIQDKDMLIVEHIENNEQIKDNRIYVFRYGDKIFIKRLVLNINQLVIKSDNSIYQPITLELSDDTDIQIIGMIVGLMRNTL